MKSNSLLLPLAFRSGVGQRLLLVALLGSAPTLSAWAGFTNQVSGTIPGVYNSSLAWGDYDNDGRLDFALAGLDAGDVPVTRIFRNQGGSFTDSGIILPGAYSGAVAWGDYDKDGKLDLLLAGATSLTYPYAPICRLYRNQGNGTFANSGVALPGVYAAAIAWGDYDKDGDLDFVLTGWGDSDRISRIYRNDGGGTFVDSGVVLPAMSYGSVAWGDYDNDGYLDLVLCGSGSSGRITRLYRNNGDGTFSDSGIALTGVTTGSVGWGDYDNDGDLDLFLTGSTGSARISQVYTNHGNGSLTDSGIGLTGLASSAGCWADYDNDGDLDLMLMGDSGNGLLTLLYVNDGNGSFSQSGSALPGMASGSVAWGDYDNSGQIDLLLTGLDASYNATIYLGRNTSTIVNAAPPVLTGLTTRLSGRDVTLSWNRGTDDHTPSPGLHYNLRLGTVSGGGNIVPPMADPTNGFRRVVRLGNGARTNAWTVKGLPDGTYYWSVQAIDTAFGGGRFATEASFTVPSNPPTDISLNPAQVSENQPIGTTVGKFTATDLNADDTHVFTLVSGPGDADNGSFTIAADELKTAVVFDFETRNSYQIRVRATDPGGLYCEKAFAIAVMDSNEPPEARCRDVTVEAGVSGTASASIDNGSFDNDAGDAIALGQSPPGPYPAGTNIVTLIVTDSRGASNSCVATITVTDTTPPYLSCPPNLILEAPPGQCGAELSYHALVTVWDNCDPSPVITSVPPAGTLLPVGRTNVLVIASDASGNSSSRTIAVSVYPPGTAVAGVDWTMNEPVAALESRTWSCVAGSASGVVIAAVNGGRLQVSRDYGATWTEREDNRNWQSVASSADGSKLAAVVFGGRVYTSSDSGETWTARESSRNWSAIACSTDGTKLVAAVYGGQIYTSADSGASWTPHENFLAWSSVACSADGNTMAAAVRGGQIYTSTNSGADWMPQESSRQWASIACSTGGDFMVAAVADGQIFTSVDYGSSWTPRATTNAWSAVACSQYSLIVAAVNGDRLFTSTDLGQTWTERATTNAWSSVAVPPGSDILFAAANGDHVYSSWDSGATWDVAAMTRLWTSLASSSDGMKLVAAANGGRIYTSADSGTNWIGGETNRAWSAVASSSDGTKLVATVNGGSIYTSADSGQTWTPRESSRQWGCVSSSADGTKLAAAVYGGQVYTSADSGQTWTPRDSSRNWSAVGSSADGTKLVATVFGGQLYISTNSGLAWTARDSSRQWSAVASSANGTKLIAAVSGGRLYTSTDSGLTWTARENNRQWSAVSSSADGTKLAALDRNNGRIYLSTDSGLTWRPRGSNRKWQAIASSADGMRLAAGVLGGRIYTSEPTIIPPAPPTILGASDRLVGATSFAGAVVTFTVTATNICQPDVPVTCTPPSGSTFPFGTNIVVCEAVDAFGVHVTNTFTVAVVERPEQGGWRQALTLNGAEDHATVPDLVLTNTPFTIEVWARRASSGTWDAFLAQGNPETGKGLFFALASDNRAAFSFYGGGLFTTNTYTDSAWHHWAATYDPAAGRCLYRDGVLIAADDNTAPYAGSGPLLIGAIPWMPDGGFDGSLDDVRIWSEARTAEQIWSDMLHPLTGRNPGLLAYWTFNSDADGAINDGTINGHDGTLVGSPVRTDSTVPPWGYSLSLDGDSAYVDMPDGVYFAGDLTIEAWVFARGYNYWSRILDFGNGAPLDNVLLALSDQTSGKPAFYVYNETGSHSITAPQPIPTNQWVHLAATLNGDIATLYINGTQVVSGQVTAPNGVVRTNNYLGRSPWSGDGYLAASLDEVRIWNVARTEAEIQAGLGQPLNGTEPGLIAYWSFDEGGGASVLDSTANAHDGALNGPLRTISTVGGAPLVTTLPASAVTSTGTSATATLNAMVTPNLAPTTAWFEWGVTTNYGNRTPAIDLNSRPGSVGCSNSLDSLTAGQTYHYRVVAENGFGQVAGEDQQFGTILITLNGSNPMTNQARTTFSDPGFAVQNALDVGAQDIAAGLRYSLALKADSTVVGWGGNDSGQANIPLGLGGVVAVSAGGYHNLALAADGTVVAWGNNDYDQTTPPAGLTGVAIAAGYTHSLALKTDGAVEGWGRNNYGQAAPPAGLTNVVAIAAGVYHSLALKADGTIIAWGNNTYGQITIPSGLTSVAAVSAGYFHTLALKADGTVAGWGWNDYGQATPPADLTNAVAIASGYLHSLALKADGTVVGWGDNSYGQAIPPAGLSNVVAIAAGGYHSLALKADGSVVGWGLNADGQTGLTTVVGGGVNTSLPGLYTVSYTAVNGLGWRATTERTVRIVDLPIVNTLPVINVTSGTVALQSLVNPNGLDTFAWFQLGPTADYSGATEAANLGDGFGPASCSIEVANLTPKATYHYRAVATNSLGTVYGPDSMFTVFSTDHDLAALNLGDAVLTPDFDPAVTGYAARVPNEVGYLVATPVSADDGATIRVRVNGGAFSLVASGAPSAPLILGTGDNLVEVEVTAQDGVTKKTYAVAVTRDSPSEVFVGPAFPPPGDVVFTESGSKNDDQIGRAGGKTWTFSGASLATQTLLCWGATNNGVKLSFNDGVFDTNEVLTYQPAVSNLANGIVIWSGQTLTPPLSNVYTRFVLAVTNTATGVALPLIEASSLGLPTNIGAVVRVTPGLAWTAVLRFQASFSPNGPFEPALDFFDREVATNVPTARAYSSFGAGFYHVNFPPELTANNVLTVDRGTVTQVTPSVLAATDFENGATPALLRFTIAPEGQGGSTRNGILAIGSTNLAAGDSFTQDDINSGRLVYVHSGNCETNDDFTFNVTDQNGGVTPTGEHTTYTFHIAIAQPNVPPVALNGSASTGLQVPYHGVLPATNTDCTPQTLRFQIVAQPVKGSISLDDANTGAFTYTPAEGQEGTDSFKFQVNDGFIDSLYPGTFTITIANQPPVANAGSGVTRENVPLSGTLTGTDPDRPPQALTFAIASNGTKGDILITNAATGAFTYTPNPGAIGEDSFTFTASDGTLTSAPAAFTVNIRPNVEEGDLLLSDMGAGQIVLVDSTGAQGVVAAGGLLSAPHGLAFDPAGTILVLDGENGLLRIDPISGSQAVVCSNTNFSTEPMGAWGIALEPGGTILVADGVNGVRRVDPATGSAATLTVSNHLALPVSIAVASTGDIFVGDAAGALGESSRLVHVDPSSGAQTLLSSGEHLFLPTGIAFDTSGNLLVTEGPTAFGGGPDLVLSVNPANGAQTVLTASNLLAIPIGLATSSTGTIYVANMASGNIVAVDPATGDQTLFSSEGPLVQPAGIAVVRIQAPNLVVSIQLVSEGVALECQGLAGVAYTLERSTNLSSWQQVTNVTAAPDGLVQFLDSSPPPGSAFYRVRLR